MADRSFGMTLRKERERLGLSLEQATQGTRIRMQILQSFEECDFENMPPKGYARNMIGSYARWLGLDPRKVVDEYLSDLEAYETANNDNDLYSNYGRRQAPSPRNGSSRQGRTGQMERTKRYQRPDQQRRSIYQQNPRRQERSHGGQGEGHGSRRPPQPSYANQYSGTLHYMPSGGTPINNIPSRNGKSPRASRIFADTRYKRVRSGGMRSRLVVIIIVVVLVIVLATIIASAVSSHNKSQQAVETPTVNTEVVSTDANTQTGTETTQTQTQTGTTTTSTAIAAPFTVSFTVADGATTNVTVTVDGMEAYSGTAIGPVTQSYDVSTSVEMRFSSPENVTVSLSDGTPVDVVTQSDGTGVVSLAVTSTQE